MTTTDCDSVLRVGSKINLLWLKVKRLFYISRPFVAQSTVDKNYNERVEIIGI